MTQKVGSFYNKSLLTRGTEKATQVIKRQKAKAAIDKITKKQVNLGKNMLCYVMLSSIVDSVLLLCRVWFG